ncbi:hypothetical protein R3P38DRAFT_2883052 [Favolaschia claudopus]|uniref:F-box domain-containing protein n=1 Tax=Favolaschia claudopus TaxID=2862362 RepID=A0AAW0D1F5_9AGAR
MHRCLEIQELVRLIFESLTPIQLGVRVHNGEKLWKEQLQQVLNLAITCRAFSEPALDLLWKRQDTLFNLLKTFPPSLWEVQVQDSEDFDEDSEAAFKFCGTIQSSHWDRTQFYARRISSMQLNCVPLDVLDALSRAAPADSACLLPNVQYVSWLEDDTHAFSHAQLLLGSRLTSIFLRPGNGRQFRVYSPLLAYLSTHHQSLTRFSLYSLGTTVCDEGLTNALSACLPALQQLQEVMIQVLTAPVLRTLSALPELRELVVYHLQDSQGFQTDDDASGTLVFPSLERLVVHAEDLPDVNSLLHNLGSKTPLRNFYGKTEQSPLQSHVHDFFTSFRDQRSLLHLTDLHMEFAQFYNGEKNLTGTTITPNLLHPLLGATNLRHLLLLGAIGLHLTNTFCVAMAEALPHLVTLSLHFATYTTEVNIISLAAFARHCPKLHYIQMPLSATDLTEVDEDSLPPPQIGLESLHVLRSPISESPTLVARLLAKLFPSLRYMSSNWRDDGEERDVTMGNQWNEVRELLKSR